MTSKSTLNGLMISEVTFLFLNWCTDNITRHHIRRIPFLTRPCDWSWCCTWVYEVCHSAPTEHLLRFLFPPTADSRKHRNLFLLPPRPLVHLHPLSLTNTHLKLAQESSRTLLASQGCLPCKLARANPLQEVRDVWWVVLVYCLHQSWRFTRGNSANTSPIWRRIHNFCEFQYNNPSAQSHQQLNGFVYSNICLYIPDIACNTSSVWPKVIIWPEVDHILCQWLSLADVKFWKEYARSREEWNYCNQPQRPLARGGVKPDNTKQH